MLIQHGVLDSADFAVMHGDQDSPAFVLANSGYDVWVSNSRGNKYSRDHVSKNPDKDDSFWDFSFTEMVEDYKANIEYILSHTKTSKIPIIGHSQGTTSAYAGMSSDPEWFHSRVSLFIALASVTRLDHMTSKLLSFFCSTPFALNLLNNLHIHELFPSNFAFKTSSQLL